MSEKDEWVWGQAVNEKERRETVTEAWTKERWSRRGEERQMNCWEKKKKGEGKRAGGANDGRREGSKPDRDGGKE